VQGLGQMNVHAAGPQRLRQRNRGDYVCNGSRSGVLGGTQTLSLRLQRRTV
jgi:hypothetical protein